MELFRLIPLVIFGVIFIKTGESEYLAIGILISFGISLLFVSMALVPTGGKNVGRLERLAR